MQVVKIIHDDFDLVIECNNFESTFNKAKKKQSQIYNSTSYTVNEGNISIYDFDSKVVENINVKNSYPVFFENKEYFIGINLKNNSIENPKISSRIKELEEKFFFRKEIRFLAGTINFGNDLGKSDLILSYSINSTIKRIKFEFEVFPTKLDYKNDYLKIIKDIEKNYPYLVLDFLKKTYSSFNTGYAPNTDLIWWQVFGCLYKDFINSTNLILSKPHSRITTIVKYTTADKVKNWSPKLEEEYFQNKKNSSKKYRIENKVLTTNTIENQFFKFAIVNTTERYKRVKEYIESRYSKSISPSFKIEVNAIEKELENLKMNPFFKSIDNFNGIRQESLVLQKATGYSTLYRSWIMLNSGLKFLDGIQKIETKNIAELYQIWCFLEIKSILQKLLKKDKPDDVELAEIQVDDFVFKIERGVKSKVSFKDKNGDIIDLYHDFSYSLNENDENLSYTISQKPDIVLRISRRDLIENYKMTYLFDAKYRLASDDKENSPELPPDDAINQMHRYRDAIYFTNTETELPEKEVIGAYVLFPGSGDINSIKDYNYSKSIDKINIGAFPLVPNDNKNKELLEEHLTKIIGLNTEKVISEISPYRQNKYLGNNPIVLIGFVPSTEHSKCFGTDIEPFYYTGIKKPSKFGFENLKYFAPYEKDKGIKEYFEIISYEIVPRNEIKNSPKAKKDDISDRLLIYLGKRVIISGGNYFKISDGKIGQNPYRYTNLFNIRNLKNNKIKLKSLTQ